MIGFVIGTLVVRRFSSKLRPEMLILIGTIIMVLGGTALVIPGLMSLPSVWGINAAMIVFVSGLGIVVPVANAQALQAHGAHAGIASALFGVSQMGVAAIASAIVAWLETPFPLASFQIVMASAAVLQLFVATGLALNGKTIAEQAKPSS